ncbi:MAG: palindromic element RPE1 domain-containing protein, partial [Holosporales bacterium]|nr:palindromic element RPE1 domain-containing protein [Holosporales bacterium]
WEGDTEHRSGAYLDVREHSSTGSTYPKTDFEEFGKRSNETFSLLRSEYQTRVRTHTILYSMLRAVKSS